MLLPLGPPADSSDMATTAADSADEPDSPAARLEWGLVEPHGSDFETIGDDESPAVLDDDIDMSAWDMSDWPPAPEPTARPAAADAGWAAGAPLGYQAPVSGAASGREPTGHAAWGITAVTAGGTALLAVVCWAAAEAWLSNYALLRTIARANAVLLGPAGALTAIVLGSLGRRGDRGWRLATAGRALGWVVLFVGSLWLLWGAMVRTGDLSKLIEILVAVVFLGVSMMIANACADELLHAKV